MTWQACEEAIVERLRSTLGDSVKAVYTASEFADVDENSQITPSVAVVYGGYAPTQTPGGAAVKVQEIEQTWAVVVSVRNARESRLRVGAREDSSPIVRACIEALIGWRPDVKDEMPLRLASSQGGALFGDKGLAIYPIGFTNRRTYRGID